MTVAEWRPFVDRGYQTPVKSQYFRVRLSTGSDIVIGYTPGEPWIDVFARKRKNGDPAGQASGDVERYGFHSEWSRWSFGAGPVGAHEIRSLLRVLVPTIRDRAAR